MASRMRNTRQKQAIESAFGASPRPLTVPEVHALASEVCERLGVATVYRAVNRLVEDGWLEEVCLPNQPVRYERTSLAHHHHFHCEQCEQVLDTAAPCESLETSVPEGFKVLRHELTFYGICADCLPAS